MPLLKIVNRITYLSLENGVHGHLIIITVCIQWNCIVCLKENTTNTYQIINSSRPLLSMNVEINSLFIQLPPLCRLPLSLKESKNRKKTTSNP
uniref:Ovule protein n=1 Tax=Heterorhabditis bacteriophora TaxID=37862 RepID=A0A1I7WFP7_HETBA